MHKATTPIRRHWNWARSKGSKRSRRPVRLRRPPDDLQPRHQSTRSRRITCSARVPVPCSTAISTSPTWRTRQPGRVAICGRLPDGRLSIPPSPSSGVSTASSSDAFEWITLSCHSDAPAAASMPLPSTSTVLSVIAMFALSSVTIRPAARRTGSPLSTACAPTSIGGRPVGIFPATASGVSGCRATSAAWVAASGMSPAAGVFTGLFSICSRCFCGSGFDSAFCIAPPVRPACAGSSRRRPVLESLQRSLQIFHAHGRAHARHPAPVRSPHGTRSANGALARRPPSRSAALQPPLAPPGAEAAPGMLAPLPAAPLPGMPDGAVDGAADMPLVAPDSPLSLFFWQPAPAARPAIRMPAKTARDT
ncbi:hypothetical protein EMIT0111MI5_10699 [Burkholderia sp. IT-111MI5]